MSSRLNYFMIQLVASIRWSYWLAIAAVLMAVIVPTALHFFAGLSVVHLGTGPLDPHPQG